MKNLKNIRNILIVSLLLQTIAIILLAVCVANMYKYVTNTNISFNISSLSQALEMILDVISKTMVSIMLFGVFLFLSFIAFWILPIIAAAHYGSKLEKDYYKIKKTLVFCTPACLVFFIFTIFIWYLVVIIGIVQSNKAFKNLKNINTWEQNTKNN